MKCKMNGCSGMLSTQAIYLRVNCAMFRDFYPCSQCGRIHMANGEFAFNRQGYAVFLEDGQVVNKNEIGEEMSRF